VNLETHTIIGLLADREAESVRQWLATHPEVDIVSRDRGKVSIDGATVGAPQATQVADQWHILSNLGDAVEAFLIRAHIRLPEQGAAPQKEQVPDKPLSSFSATPASQRKSQARLLRKWNLYQQVQHLHASGMSLRKIGEELGIARNTVRKYFRQPPEPPLPTPRPLRASQLDPYEEYLLERWSQGERNAAQVYREINARGYRGAATMVRAYISHLRTSTADGSPARSRKQRAKALSPRSVRWLLTRKRADLKQEDETRLEQLLGLSAEVQTIYGLLQAFLKMVRERQHQDVRGWMEQAVKSGIPELKSFVMGIERDYDAVHAALRLPWSQGITEGKVNKRFRVNIAERMRINTEDIIFQIFCLVDDAMKRTASSRFSCESWLFYIFMTNQLKIILLITPHQPVSTLLPDTTSPLQTETNGHELTSG